MCIIIIIIYLQRERVQVIQQKVSFLLRLS